MTIVRAKGYSALSVTTLGAVHTFFVPRQFAGGYACILLHGAGNSAQYMDAVVQPASVRLAAHLARNGIYCITSPFGGDLFNTVAAMTWIDTARTALAASVYTDDYDHGKVLLVGASMGGGQAARYSIEKPNDVAAVVGIIPAFDNPGVYANTPAIRAQMDAAYGTTYPGPLPSRADNIANAAPAKNVPLLAMYSTADNMVPYAGVEAYADAVGGEKIIASTTDLHTDAAIGKCSPDTIVRFLKDNGG